MYSSRFQFPEPVSDSRLLKNSCRLKLDLLAFGNDDDPPGTITVGYMLEGELTLKPDDNPTDVFSLIAAFRAAQAEKGGGNEIQS